jgi:hypothetical protein
MVFRVGVKFNDSLLGYEILGIAVTFFGNLVTNLGEFVNSSDVNVEGDVTCGSSCGGTVYCCLYIYRAETASPNYAFVVLLPSAAYGSRYSYINLAEFGFGPKENLIHMGAIRGRGLYVESWWQGYIRFEAEAEGVKVVRMKQISNYEPYCFIAPHCIGNAVGLALPIVLVL